MKLARLLDDRFKTSIKKLIAEPLPLPMAIKLKNITKCIDEELSKYEEIRAAAVAKLGKKKENGALDVAENGNVKFDSDNLKLFLQEIGAATNVEVDVSSISAGELGSAIKLSAEDLMNLDGLLVD